MDEPPVLDIEGYLNDPAGELRRCAHAGWYAAGIDEQGEPLPFVLGLDQVRTVLRDRRLSPRSFPDAMRRNGLSDQTAEQFTPLFRRHGDAHRAHRGLLAAAFTPRRIEQLRPFIAATAERLVDRIAAGGGRCDFVAEFAGRLPSEVFAELFGIPTADVDRLTAWASVIVVAFSPFMTSDQVGAVEQTAAEMRDWAHDLIAARRAEPADDLVTHLLEVEIDGQRLGEQDVVEVITGFVFAGSETTKRQLVEMIAAFAVHPDSWSRLLAEPELVANAVEEVLRFRPIVPALTRVAEEPFELDGLGLAPDARAGRVVPHRQPRSVELRRSRCVRRRARRSRQPRDLRLGPALLSGRRLRLESSCRSRCAPCWHASMRPSSTARSSATRPRSRRRRRCGSPSPCERPDMARGPLSLATRGSALARWQANFVHRSAARHRHRRRRRAGEWSRRGPTSGSTSRSGRWAARGCS